MGSMSSAISSYTFRHGGDYHYRLHGAKLKELCGEDASLISSLGEYLRSLLKGCPSDPFMKGPRGSVLKFSLNPVLEELKHEVMVLARMGLDSGYYGNAHMNVEMFMLAYDSKTIAVEIPIWLMPQEMARFEEIFGSDLPLSGHIDILRIEDGKIWIWDYKPNAHREKFAATQTYFYAVMLSKRTGLPLDVFRCGYFDDKSVYVFEPSKIVLK